MSFPHEYVARSRKEQHRLLAKQYSVQVTRLFARPGTTSSIKQYRKTSKTIPSARDQSTSPVLSLSTLVEDDRVEVSEKQDSITTISCIGKTKAKSLFTELTNLAQNKHELQSRDDFQVYLIEQENSYSRLKTSLQDFDYLCDKLAIFDSIRGMIIHLGLRSEEIEIAPPRPQWSTSNDAGTPGLELAYGLRWIEENGRADVWSLRQSVIYNKMNTKPSQTTWVFFGPTTNAREDLDEHITNGCCETALEKYALHFALIASSISCWRPFLVFLSEKVDVQARDISFANPVERASLGSHFMDLTAKGTRNKLKNLENKITDCTLALEANRNTISVVFSLLKAQAINDKPCGCGAKGDAVWDEYTCARLTEIDMILKQLAALRMKVLNCTQIVSSYAELDSTLRAQHDGAAVKALSVLTLIYLPTTVVLNFFSASFIDTSSGEMAFVGKWWAFIAACVPLTILTICAWQLWVWRQTRRVKAEDEERSGSL